MDSGTKELISNTFSRLHVLFIKSEIEYEPGEKGVTATDKENSNIKGRIMLQTTSMILKEHTLDPLQLYVCSCLECERCLTPPSKKRYINLDIR